MSLISEYGMRKVGKQTSSSGGLRRYRVTLETTANTTGIDELVTPELPVVDKTQLQTQKLPTQKEVRTNNSLSFSSSLLLIDGISFTDQPTWLLPVIAEPKKASNNGQTSSDSQGYLSLAFDMIKSSGIYALGAFLSPLVSLVLTPFLTRRLSNTNYGALAVLLAVIDLVTVVTQLGLSASFFRAYNGDYEAERDRLGVLAAAINILLLVSIPLAITMMVLAPWISTLLFNSPSFSESVRFTALVIMLENITLPGILWLRAEKRAVLYTALSIVNLLLTLGATLVLVGVFNMGVNGALLAKGLGYAAIVVYTYPIMLRLLVRQKSLRLRQDILHNLLSFGVPTVFSSMASWVLQLSDRYMLSRFASLAQTASYSVAYTLGGVLAALLISPFILAWNPLVYIIAKREDAHSIFPLVFRWFSIVSLFATFALSLLSTFVLNMLFPIAYHSAESIIPVVALATMFSGIYYIFVIGINIRRKTVLTILVMSIAASVNVLLNIFFIPHFGAMGAAVSTLLAYVILVLVTYIVNQKIYPIRFEIGSFIVRLSVGVALYVGSSLLAHTQKPLLSWSISICTLTLYGVFLLVHGGLSAKSIQRAFRYVQEALARKKMYAHAP
jgi:O-antigen/teichoic acid export membrane protein